jgi:hypothetical protein
MGSSNLTTARRAKPRTTSSLRCAAAFHFYFFVSSLGGFIFAYVATREIYPNSNHTGLIVYGLLLSALFLAVAVGLLRRSRLARWVGVVTSLLIALGEPVIGIALIMYLIRPELDPRFV